MLPPPVNNMKPCPFLSGLIRSTFSPITSGVIELAYNKQYPLSRAVTKFLALISPVITVCLQQGFKL